MQVITTLNIDLTNELFRIDRQINELKIRQKEIKRKLREREALEDPKISISYSSNKKYLIGKTRIKDRVLSVYIGPAKKYTGKDDLLALKIARQKIFKKLYVRLFDSSINEVKSVKTQVEKTADKPKEL